MQLWYCTIVWPQLCWICFCLSRLKSSEDKVSIMTSEKLEFVLHSNTPTIAQKGHQLPLKKTYSKVVHATDKYLWKLSRMWDILGYLLCAALWLDVSLTSKEKKNYKQYSKLCSISCIFLFSCPSSATFSHLFHKAQYWYKHMNSGKVKLLYKVDLFMMRTTVINLTHCSSV